MQTSLRRLQLTNMRWTILRLSELFRSRLDFEFAELALQAALSKEETGRLIKLVQRAITGKEQFTLATHKEVHETWTSLEHRFTPIHKLILVVCTIVEVDVLCSLNIIWYQFHISKQSMSSKYMFTH